MSRKAQLTEMKAQCFLGVDPLTPHQPPVWRNWDVCVHGQPASRSFSRGSLMAHPSASSDTPRPMTAEKEHLAYVDVCGIVCFRSYINKMPGHVNRRLIAAGMGGAGSQE